MEAFTYTLPIVCMEAFKDTLPIVCNGLTRCSLSDLDEGNPRQIFKRKTDSIWYGLIIQRVGHDWIQVRFSPGIIEVKDNHYGYGSDLYQWCDLTKVKHPDK